MLTKMFESADHQPDPIGQIGDGGASALHDGQDLDSDFHAEASIQLHVETSAQWEDENGGSHDWTHSNDLGAGVDSDTILSGTGDTMSGTDAF